MANSLSSPYTRFDWLMKAMCNVLEKVVSECLMKVNVRAQLVPHIDLLPTSCVCDL